MEVTQNWVHSVKFWQPTHEGGGTRHWPEAVWGFEPLPLLCEQKAAGWHLADPRRTTFSSTFLG